MKKIIMVLPVMRGGGAERVAISLLNKFYDNGYECEIILTSSVSSESNRDKLNNNIPIYDVYSSEHNLLLRISQIVSSVLCKPFEFFKFKVPSAFSYFSFISSYFFQIKKLKNILSKDKNAIVISFLQPSIPVTLFAAKHLPNRLIISERGNAERQMKHRYGYNFIKKYYKRADKIVFQTNDAQEIYPSCISENGIVIFNPVSNKIIEPYFDERNKVITTFCRISTQKNLKLLVDAFNLFQNNHPDYNLKIIGSPQNSADDEVFKNLKNHILNLGLSDKIKFISFTDNVHSEIIKDAMYVNSSDYEGMSNAMLEAMAIGMPVICTDCPIGGAKTIIKNGVNGMLVPVNDAKSMAEAMAKIADDKTFSHSLSINAAEIRNELSLNKIAEKWMELF